MSICKSARNLGLALGVAAFPLPGFGQAVYVPQADEYSLSGSLLGDQVHAAVALSTNGGLLVWEDNYTDGSAAGISARRLDSTLSGVLSTFRVNELGEGAQRKPDVALLSNGGAVVVWQSDVGADSEVRARFFSPGYTTYGGDVKVNSHTNDAQVAPVVAALGNGDSVVVWASHQQASPSSLRDVYFQRFNSTGQKLGGETRANIDIPLNQRDPSVATLTDGRFVIVWVNEVFIGALHNPYKVELRGRLFSPNGVAQSGEFVVNTSSNICANPALAATLDGGFLAAWSRLDLGSTSNRWDIAARRFSGTAIGAPEHLLNTHRYGDQFGPRTAALGSDVLVVWTSLRQDGSHEGVFGRFLQSDGTPLGNAEEQVNTTVVNKQMLPDVASDGGTRLLTAWSGFTGVAQGFDVFAQRFAPELEPLAALAAPYAWALNSSQITVTWPELAGFDVAAYEIYADGAVTPTASVTNLNRWTMSGLSASSSHSFRLTYLLADGRRSPFSPATTVSTYSAVIYGGIPFEWGQPYWGADLFAWPSPNADSDGDGASNRSEFLAGTDPTDGASVLRSGLVQTPQGMFLVWNTVPGRIYQVKRSTDFITWSELGQPRFAAGEQDSFFVGGGGAGVFRVQLLIY